MGNISKALCAVALLLGTSAAATAEELVVAFTLDTPPYVMKKGTTGIELDIVRAALAPAGYTIRVRQMSYGELTDAVTNKGCDAATTVEKKDDGTFYSQNYVAFRNVAITRKADGFEIDSVADLKGRSIVAWENAYEDLGPKFEALFSPEVEAAYRKKYREIADQREQVKLFWQGKAEVVVIDRAVFQWFTRELADEVDTQAELEYHAIFPETTEFRVSFAKKAVREAFDTGLAKLRKSGEYDAIVERYLK